MMGSAAFRTEKWETSIKAFKFCTTLDPEVLNPFSKFSILLIFV